MLRRRGVIAQVAVLGAIISAFPSAGSAVVPQLVVQLTANGPSPNVLKLTVSSRDPRWINSDQVTHTVTFANGLCSFQLAPGDEGGCGNDLFAHVGQYPYNVDGTVQANVIVRLNPRTVTLTAGRHTIKRGGRLTLRGELTAAHPTPGPSLQSVIVLARHGRGQAFHRIAVVHTTPHGLRALWQLRVRPGKRTTYIAEAKFQPDYWQQAKSKAFTVVVRP